VQRSRHCWAMWSKLLSSSCVRPMMPHPTPCVKSHIHIDLQNTSCVYNDDPKIMQGQKSIAARGLSTVPRPHNNSTKQTAMLHVSSVMPIPDKIGPIGLEISRNHMRSPSHKVLSQSSSSQTSKVSQGRPLIVGTKVQVRQQPRT